MTIRIMVALVGVILCASYTALVGSLILQNSHIQITDTMRMEIHTFIR
jgi:hypothetical protein